MADTAVDTEALRARVSELEGELAAARASEPPIAPQPPRPRQWWRTILAGVFLIIAALLAPLSVVATWAHDQIGNTDLFVQTVAPLASEPSVQNAVADRVSTVIITRLNVRAISNDALTALSKQTFVPPRVAAVLPGLSVPLSDSVDKFVRDRVTEFVHSPRFKELWVKAARGSHSAMVDVLSGNTTGTVRASGNAVQVNVGPIVAEVKDRLVARGFSVAGSIPAVNASFTIFQAKNLQTAQQAFSWLSALSRVLPVLALLFFLAAVVTARNRRKTLLAASLAVAAAMLLLGVALNIIRPIYLDALPPTVSHKDAAGVVFDTLVEPMRITLRAVGVVFVALALGAYWFAPTGSGAGLRKGSARWLGRVRTRTGMNTGPFGRFLARYRTFVRVVVVSLGGLAYVALDHPTVGNVVVIVAVVVVVLVVLEFLAAPRTSETAVAST